VPDGAFASPFHRSRWTPPFVQYADGTRGKEFVFELSIGELIDL
jgi:hypothetical protein